MNKYRFFHSTNHKFRRMSVENDLNLRLRQQEAISSLGEFAIRSSDLAALFDTAVRTVAQTLDVEYCKILELLPDGQELLLRAGVGWMEGLVGQAKVGAGKESQAGFTLLADQPVIVWDLPNETRFSSPKLLHDHHVVSGMSVIIAGREKPFGVLGAHTTRLRKFPSHDTGFLVSIANILASAIDRSRVEDELRRSRDELAIVLDGVSEGITAQDSRGNIVYANQSAAQTLGYASVDELLSASFSEIAQKYTLLDEDGDPFPVDKLPGRQIFQGAPSASARIHFRLLQTGEDRWSIVDANPVRDTGGKVVLAVNIFRDITNFVRAEHAQKMLAEAGKILASSLDYEATLENIANLAVTYLADWCSVHLIDENEEVYRLAVTHKDPAKVEAAREFEQLYPPDREANSPLYGVLRTGEPFFIPEITDEMLLAASRGPDYDRRLRELGLRSGMTIPLTARGRTFGAISLVWGDSGHRYTKEDIDLVLELSRRAAIAIENARLYQEAQALNAELEQRVAKRTRQLESSHQQLIREVQERRKAEADLKQSEAMLTSLFESAPDAVVLVDSDGKIVRVNRQAELLFGYLRAELSGRLVDILLPARYQQQHSLNRASYFSQMATRPMGAGLSLFALRKDGTEFPVDIMLSPFETADGILTISAIRDISEQKRLQAELDEIHRRLFESIEAERLSLSQELHDGPIQELYGITYNLEGLKKVLHDVEELETLISTKESIQAVVDTLREICGELRPPTLTHFGLEKAIRAHAHKIAETYPDLQIDLNLMDDGSRLPERVRVSLYRVYQNSMNNVIRHAQARQVTVDFQIQPEQIVLKVADNGCGFEVPSKWVELARTGHFGLVGMAERTEAIGGRFTVVSSPGHGTSIQVVVPFPDIS